MNSILKLCCLLLLTSTATTGLEFKLDLAQSGPRCGVLDCGETVRTASPPTKPRETSGESQPEPSPSLAVITSLAIFKTIRPRTPDDTEPELGEIVASLTAQQPHVTRDSDGVKVDGDLDIGRASLRLELSRRADCRAEYTCQLHGRDEQGREIERTSRLLKQPEVDASVPAAAVTLQILSYVQQLDTRLALMGKSVEGLEVTAADLQTRIDDKTGSLDDRLEDRVDSLEKTLEGAIQSFKSQVDDKIENQIVGKLWQLDAKVSALGSSLVTPQVSSKRDLGGIIHALKENLEQSQAETLNNVLGISDRVDASLNQTAGELKSMRDGMAHLKEDLQKSQAETLNNVLEICERIDGGLNHSTGVLKSVRDGMAHLATTEHEELLLVINMTTEVTKMSNLNEDVVQVGNELLLSQAALQQTIRGLEWNISGSVSDTLESIVDSLSNTSRQGLEPRVPPELKACRKGMTPVSAQPPYPYPVVAPGGESSLDVPILCDMVTDGGGWIIFQRRNTGDTNFYRDWASYRDGFGELTGDFWLGNEHLHALTSSGDYELRVELVYQDKPYFAHYSSISVSDEASQYTLRLGSYSGTAGDSLTYHSDEKFTTYDRDNDPYSDNCAVERKGAWWYHQCDNSNLNGLWGPLMPSGMEWEELGGTTRPVSSSEMKIRRKQGP